MERVHKFFQLPPNERLILAHAWGLFLLADLALRILPFLCLLDLSKKIFLKRMSSPSSPPARGGKGDLALAAVPSVPRLAWLVEVAGRYAPVAATCLKTALVLSWLLGRRGTQTELRIGVARHEGSLKAHAWLDYDGQAVLGHHEFERYETILHA